MRKVAKIVICSQACYRRGTGIRNEQASAKSRIPKLTRHSSQSFVKGDHRDINISLAFGNRVLGLQLSALSIQQQQEIDDSLAVTQPCDVGCPFALSRLRIQFN